MSGEKLNRIVLSILAPVLILTGLAGFLIPQQYSVTSGEAPYNMFHIVFGAIGLFIVSTGKPYLPSFFNVGFGLIDLYQAVASFFYLWPAQFFLWTWADDIVHIILGVGLVAAGIYGIVKQKEEARSS